MPARRGAHVTPVARVGRIGVAAVAVDRDAIIGDEVVAVQ